MQVLKKEKSKGKQEIEDRLSRPIGIGISINLQFPLNSIQIDLGEVEGGSRERK